MNRLGKHLLSSAALPHNQHGLLSGGKYLRTFLQPQALRAAPPNVTEGISDCWILSVLFPLKGFSPPFDLLR